MAKGKNKKIKAFQSAVQIRKDLINCLEKCQSYEIFSTALNNYKAKKNKHFFDVRANISEGQSTTISELDKNIDKLILDLGEKFLPPPVSMQSDEMLFEDISSVGDDLNADDEYSYLNRSDSDLNDKKPEEKDSINLFATSDAQKERKTHLAQVSAKLQSLKDKQGKYHAAYRECLDKGESKKADECLEASDAAQQLFDGMYTISNQYIDDGDLVRFKTDAKNILCEDNEHVKILEKQGLLSFLINLTALILTVGIAHAGYSIYKGKFSLFKLPTEGGEKVKELYDSVQSVAIPA